MRQVGTGAHLALPGIPVGRSPRSGHGPQFSKAGGGVLHPRGVRQRTGHRIYPLGACPLAGFGEIPQYPQGVRSGHGVSGRDVP